MRQQMTQHRRRQQPVQIGQIILQKKKLDVVLLGMKRSGNGENRLVDTNNSLSDNYTSND